MKKLLTMLLVSLLFTQVLIPASLPAKAYGDPFEAAYEAVDAAFESFLEEDIEATWILIDEAWLLVNDLPESYEKDDLVFLLLLLEDLINLVEAGLLIDTAYESRAQEDIDAARLFIEELLNNVEDEFIIELLELFLDFVGYIEHMNVVEAAVIAAEESKSQEDLDYAQQQLDALYEWFADWEDWDGWEDWDWEDDESLYDDFPEVMQARLDAVKAEIDALLALHLATVAVETAEGDKTQANVDTARALVQDLADGEDKTALTGRLDAVQAEIDVANLQLATDAVETAENDKTQANVDAAKALVQALADGEDKTALTARLDAVQAEIDVANLQLATDAVETAEGDKTQANVDAARVLVQGLADGEDKTALTARLDAVQTEIDVELAVQNATAAVETAEEVQTQENKDIAQGLVDLLPDGEEKDALQARLDAIVIVVDESPTPIADDPTSTPENPVTSDSGMILYMLLIVLSLMIYTGLKKRAANIINK